VSPTPDTTDQAAINALYRELTGNEHSNSPQNGHTSKTRALAFAPDEAIIDKARAEEGGKFDRLFRGDLSDYRGDHSAADDGFVHKLWPYTQDALQIKRIHAASDLSRPKSEQRHDYLDRSINRARKNVTWFYEWPEGPDSFFSSPIGDDDDEKRNSSNTEGYVPFALSVSEFLKEAGDTPDWCVETMLVFGAVTTLAGEAKVSGKTTLTTHMVEKIRRGHKFMGHATKQSKVVYLTEQGNNFAEAMRKAGLDKANDWLRIIPYRLANDFSWPELVQRAVEECRDFGARVLVVDTFIKFAGITGTEENNAGDIAERMRPLVLAAQKDNLAVLLTRHGGKHGRGRGSSQFEADADIVLELRRKPGGKHSERTLESVGRYDAANYTVTVELAEDGYKRHNAKTTLTFDEARAAIKKCLPTTKAGALPTGVLWEKVKDGDFSGATFNRALTALVDEGIARCRKGEGRGAPNLYWLYTPEPPGSGDSLFSSCSPSKGDEKKEKENSEERDRHHTHDSGGNGSPSTATKERVLVAIRQRNDLTEMVRQFFDGAVEADAIATAIAAYYDEPKRGEDWKAPTAEALCELESEQA
jgi:hypothetical protein